MLSEKRKKLDEKKKLKTRDNLIKSAIEIFIENGYHKTNISDIVKRANVGQGTFYRNFKSKREIFEEILQKLSSELISEFSEGFLNTKNTPSSFKEYNEMSVASFLRAVPIMKKYKDIVILFFRDASTIDKEFEKEINDIFEQFSSLAKYYLDDGIKKGFVRDCNTIVISQSIIGIAIQLIKDWLYGKYQDSEIENIVIEANNLVFLGLSTPIT